MLPAKAFGCFRHRAVGQGSPFLQGFSDSFLVPVSRWTEVRSEDVGLHPDLATLISSEDVGPCLVDDPAHRALYMFNHLEYDSTTLKEEYERDVAAGGPVIEPADYFPDDDPVAPAREPLAQPRPAALRQLDQPDLPDHALRRVGDRELTAWTAGRFWPEEPPFSPPRAARAAAT